MILTCAALMLSAAGAWALPNCPSDPNAVWSNCLGTHTFPNGHKYVGEWKNNKRTGQGTFTWPVGDKYVGEWKDDKANGQGTLTYANGDKYVGEHRDDMFHGQGTYTYASGNKYVGKWEDDKRNGQGTFTWPDGEKYVGEFKDDMFHGQGTYTLASGKKYVGEFKDDMFHGQGTYTWPDGKKYVGEFKDDMFHGQGTFTWPDGEKYVGEFKDDMFHGHGTFFYSNGDLYMGAWVKDLRQGRGDLKLKNGDRYVGDFSGDKPSGTGTLYFKNDDRYHGGFRVGKFHGQGTFTHADGTVEEGTWENDQLKYPKEAEPPPVTEVKPQDDEVLEASSGSGFAVSSDGYVITNNHVIEGCQEVAVYEGGRAVPATVVTYDLQNDLALLKADFTPKTVFALSADQPELLQDVYVAGYPFGNEISSSIKVTKGIISSLTGIGNNFSNIQIDAALQVGNSGGPILDESGNVVGVAVSKLDAKYMYDNFGTIPENTNFGIKANVVRSVLDSNGVSSPSPSTDEITKSELGTRITGGTYYVSCMMTLAQIEVLKTKKVMFENLD